MAAEQSNVGDAPRAMSSWAVASLMCSMAMCCPAVSIISVMLGIRALAQISADARFKGRRLAIAGIVIGVAGTLIWIGGLTWGYFNARLPLLHGPRAELRAGFNGDIASFKAGFTGEGAIAPDMEAATFLADLTQRYGGFVDSWQNPTATPVAPTDGSTDYRIAYTLQFERKAIEAEASFRTFGQPSMGFIPNVVFKWNWIRIRDADRGDLVYPAGAEQLSAQSPSNP